MPALLFMALLTQVSRRMGALRSWVYGVHAQDPMRAAYRLAAKRWGGDMKDTYRYIIHAYKNAKWKRPLNHQLEGPPSSPTAPWRSGSYGKRGRCG
jgi:hypothetical protein